MSRFLQWLTGVKKNEVKTFSDEDIKFNNLIKMIDDDIVKIESGLKSENVELKLKIHYGGHMFDKYDHVKKEIAVIFAYIKEIIKILHSTGLYSAYMLEDELYASYSHYDHICPDFNKPEHWYSMSKKHYRLLFSNRRYDEIRRIDEILETMLRYFPEHMKNVEYRKIDIEELKRNDEKLEENESKDEYVFYIDRFSEFYDRIERFVRKHDLDRIDAPFIDVADRCGEAMTEMLFGKGSHVLQNNFQRKFIIMNDSSDVIEEISFDGMNERFGKIDLRLLKGAASGIYAIAGDKDSVMKMIKYVNDNFKER